MANIANLAVQLTLQMSAFTGNLSKAQRSILNLSATVGRGARTLQRYGLILNGAVAAGLFLAARAGAEFEASMARVDAITQATAEEFLELSDAARRMGQVTIFTAVQAAEALRELSQAGFSVREALIALKPVLDFAVAGGLDLAEAADIAARVMRGMGIEAKDLEHNLNIMAAAFTKAPTNIQELGEAFKFVGPVGRAAGKDMAELTAILTVFARAGFRGEQAGTALRNILLRLQAQPSEVKKALEQLGIQVADETGKLKSLATVFEEVRLATSRMTKVEQNAIISRIAGIRATAAFSAAMQAGSDEIRALTTEYTTSGDVIGRISKRQLVTAESQWLLLKSAITETLLTMNDELKPALISTLKFLTELAKSTAKFIEENKTLVKGVIITTVVLGTLLIVLGALAIVFVAVTAAVIAFSSAMVIAAIPMALAIIGFGALAIAIGVVTVGLFAFIKTIRDAKSGLIDAEERLRKLNKTQGMLTETNKKLTRSMKAQADLAKKIKTAEKAGRVADAARLELAQQDQLLKSLNIRHRRTVDLANQRIRMGQATGVELRVLTNIHKQLNKEWAIRRKIFATLEEKDKIQKKLLADRAAAILKAQQEAASEKTNKLLFAEKLNLLKDTNSFAAKRVAILMRESKLLEKNRILLTKSGLSTKEQAARQAEFQKQLEAITKQRQNLLEKERTDRIQSFTRGERELQLLRVRATAMELLATSRSAAERLKIEQAFNKKKAEMLDKFRKEDEKANQKGDTTGSLTQPGAFREGTVEAFRAAFSKNPLLDESKKQTEEQKEINKKLQDIKLNTKENNGVGQAKINVG